VNGKNKNEREGGEINESTFEVHTAVLLKTEVYCDVMPCRLVNTGHISRIEVPPSSGSNVKIMKISDLLGWKAVSLGKQKLFVDEDTKIREGVGIY
jgi:hypothetical protein